MAHIVGAGDAHHVWYRVDRRFVLFCLPGKCAHRTENKDELAGNLWPCMEVGSITWRNIRSRPKTIPKHLHWFKYEAYFYLGLRLWDCSSLYITSMLRRCSLIRCAEAKCTQALASVSVRSIVAWVCMISFANLHEKNKWLFALVGIVLLTGFHISMLMYSADEALSFISAQ